MDISKYDVMDESQMAAVAAVQKARGERGAMDILGDGWEKQQSADLLRGIIDKLPSDGLGAVGTGLGLGAAVGGLLDGRSRQLSQNSVSAQTEYSGREIKINDPMVALAKLKELFDAGLISESEYSAKRAEVLGRL
ncbi:MAG: SHOCT domain-containing protein [Clostridiales bacterium]|nr:SHOCT domain-containing protein [Clostridiales bacterium]